jgi:photosystem II stability/assembly factor-like uncharacterized protein
MMRFVSLAAAACLLLVCPTAGAQEGLDAYSAMAARSIGPAGMSGRVTAIRGLPSNPSTLYVGTATGGLWFTADDGLTWERRFDDQPVASIGAVYVDPERPEVLWVGTGEGNPRNSASVGNGVYRSLDGGRSWTHLGLEKTEKIHRLLVHPDKPDTAWVAALGTSWGENSERGVFKTTDGGVTWRKVLYVDESTGCADLALDPSNPDKLIAAMWDHRRDPHFFRSGGPGSGLYVTRDGGETWQQRGAADGLPKGELGRMGVAFSASSPNVVYALVENENKNALLRSDDGGASFRTVNDKGDVGGRPFYYADIRVDPQDPDRIYSLESVVLVSDDGGKNWSTLIPYAGVHPDHHAMWISPTDPSHIVEGNDGGLAISRTRGESWRFVRNLPLAQYYHIAVDNELPYNVYGGMQDNGSWRGPSNVWENGGIRNHHWREVGFGDGFATVPMADDAQRGYAMSQGGALMRWDLRTGERKGIRPDGPEDVELRFNWNAGIALDPFDPAGVFYGSQFVHRSTDRGDTWTTISPDLTTNNPDWQRQDESGGLTPDVTAAENYCSIVTIAPSPLDKDTIWVGTDDGRLHVTHDGGQSWTSLEEGLFGVPRNTWIPHIEAGKHDAQTAYVVCEDHQRANWTPYVFKTTDGGVTWTDLATPDLWGYVHVIEEDPVDPNLLFLGTEFGLFVSQDGGAGWERWTHGVPTCPVRALVVQPREHDLVIGTFGRSAYVIDDLRPLRAAPEPEPVADGEEAAPTGLRLCEIPDAYQYRVAQTRESRFPGDEEFRGQTRPRGARLSIMVADDVEDTEASISFIDGDGKTLRRIERDVSTGLNRVVWNMRETGFRTGGGFGGGDGEPRAALDLPGGPEVLPGVYTVRVELGERNAEQTVTIHSDPRVEVSLEGRAARNEAIRRAGKLSERLALATPRIDRVRADLVTLKALADRAKDPNAEKDAEHPHQALLDAIEAFEAELDGANGTLRGKSDTKGINRNPSVARKVRGLPWGLGSSWDAPTAAELRRIDEAAEELDEAITALNGVLSGETWKALESAFKDSGLRLLDPGDPIE